jgi:4a-hydroxytetrahydrobiopterin dehydratase
MPTPMSRHQIDEFCRAHSEWSQEGEHLVSAVTADTFLDAIALVSAVAQAAEEMDHHPDIDIRWRTVTFRLRTHSASAITDLDLRLAEQISDLASS